MMYIIFITVQTPAPKSDPRFVVLMAPQISLVDFV